MSKSKYIKINGKSIYKIGNKKIGQDTLIFNMQPAQKCYCDKMGLCQFGQNGNGKCYALRNERQYPSVREYRNRQMKYWQNSTISQIIDDLAVIFKQYPQIKYVRWNESGDIQLKDLIRIDNIAQQFPHITFYTYTHNKPLADIFKDMELPDNLIINGSGFKWTNNYSSIDKINTEFASKNLICKGNCRHCNLCKSRHGQTIYEEIF